MDEVNIRRYLRRKPELVVRYRRGYREMDGVSRVRCVTPPPAPEGVWVMGEAEGMLMDCRDYFLSSWGSGEWVVDGEGMVVCVRSGRRGTEVTDDVMTKFYTAADLLCRSNYAGAFKVLDLAFRSAGELVVSNAPRVVSVLLTVFWRLVTRGQRDTLDILRRYIAGQADGGGGGLGKVLRRVSSLEVESYADVFPRMYDLMIEQADDIFGPGSNLGLEIYWHRFAGFVMQEDTMGQIRSLKKELDKIHPNAEPKPWVLRHRRLYAWKTSQMKRDGGFFDEAQEALDMVKHTYTEDPAGAVDFSRHWGFAAMVEIKRGDLGAAERYFRESVRLSMLSNDEDAVQYSMFKLCQTLDMMPGREEEAKRIRAWSRGRIDEITAAVQWDWDEFQRRTAVEPVVVPSPSVGSETESSGS